MKDTKVQSLIRGRLGAAVLSLVATLSIIFGLTPDQQQTATELTNQVFQWIGGGSAIGAAVLAFLSKLREK